MLGLGSGLHALRRAHEQLVAQRGAQAGQGVAHRRLTHVESFGGARGVPLLHYCVEHHEKVEVDLSPVHVTSRFAAPDVDIAKHPDNTALFEGLAAAPSPRVIPHEASTRPPATVLKSCAAPRHGPSTCRWRSCGLEATRTVRIRSRLSD